MPLEVINVTKIYYCVYLGYVFEKALLLYKKNADLQKYQCSCRIYLKKTCLKIKHHFSFLPRLIVTCQDKSV